MIKIPKTATAKWSSKHRPPLRVGSCAIAVHLPLEGVLSTALEFRSLTLNTALARPRLKYPALYQTQISKLSRKHLSLHEVRAAMSQGPLSLRENPATLVHSSSFSDQ